MQQPTSHKVSAAADSRRDFIRGSSLLLASAVPAALASAATVSSETFAQAVQGKPKLRLGVVGCGFRGIAAASQMLGSTAAEVQLVAVADLFEDRLQQACRTLKGKFAERFAVEAHQRFTGIHAAQRVFDADVDVVILATPPSFRPQHVLAAVEAGKHVIAEKPVAIDPPGIRQFLAGCALATEKQLSVSVGLQRRYTPSYQQTVAQLHAGAIGDLVFARAYSSRPMPRLHERRKGQTTLEHQLRNWQHCAWLSGESIVEEHVQSLDVMNWIAQAHPIEALGVGAARTQATATSVAQTSTTSPSKLEDYVCDFGYASGLRLISINRWTNGTRAEFSEWVHGTHGACDVASGKIYDRDQKLIWKADGSRAGHQPAIDHFLASLTQGIPVADGEAAADSTLTAILGRTACHSLGRVHWSECAASNQQLIGVQDS
ncbi:MAG: Gfo/Idh/MocA family oxidoreductase [Pirellulaceae bacterium]